MFMRAGKGNDLAAINLQRGRDHGIPGYNSWRKWCKLPPLKSWKDFAQIAVYPEAVDKYSKLYVSVDDVDLWTGILVEKTLPDAPIGAVAACIMGEQFKNFKYGDSFWYDNAGFKSSFSPDQLYAIKKVTFSSLICLLSDDISHMQVWGLALPDQKHNPVMSCEHIPKLDLRGWMGMKPQPVPETHSYGEGGGEYAAHEAMDM
eukprot:TRINITY_DN670_c0_g1_i4.p1 TRINITY_DN670_c0_g1~~TRINITY_DN670_c0_g1_i4.p1  ORF type:complete len:203 (-),score=42.45 TRINITY_DN670_c0_g1_i4:100-708(-)